VNLDSRTVGGEQVDGHASLLPDQPGPSAFGNQLGLEHGLRRLAGVRIRIAHRQQKALSGLARLHLPDALSGEGDAHPELASQGKLALHLAEPIGESIGLGDCSPKVVNSSVEAIFHPYNTLAID
jgi:hypothetical protein